MALAISATITNRGRRNDWVAPPVGFMISFKHSWAACPIPRRMGNIPAGQSTPACTLNLQPGELVRVKSYNEILATLSGVMNRGLHYDAEQVPYCDGVYRVRTRVGKIYHRKDRKDGYPEDPCSDTRRCLVPGSL